MSFVDQLIVLSSKADTAKVTYGTMSLRGCKGDLPTLVAKYRTASVVAA
jgi:hypothetical protein